MASLEEIRLMIAAAFDLPPELVGLEPDGTLKLPEEAVLDAAYRELVADVEDAQIDTETRRRNARERSAWHDDEW